MYEIYERLTAVPSEKIRGDIVLDHLQRERGRFRAWTSGGEEVRVFLERGQTLRVGEILRAACGACFVVAGAEEEVTWAGTDDWQLFSRACYHLGNRHTKVQIGARWLRISRDHVLEDMLRDLGLQTRDEVAVFIPESGAYAGKGHAHHHGDHDHGDHHDHSHGHHHH
ncbi:urease accessory protein UreE [Haliea sp. E17]|uniref:urease accessory protein UreE n=1 Tax=Haliea sp. E17 TaxID=3401576 RepID=UPI003AADEF88